MLANGIDVGLLVRPLHGANDLVVLKNDLAHMGRIIVFDGPDRLDHAGVIFYQADQRCILTARILHMMKLQVQGKDLAVFAILPCRFMIMGNLIQFVDDI